MPSNISVSNSLPLTQLLTKDSSGAQECRDIYCSIMSVGTQLADEDFFNTAVKAEGGPWAEIVQSQHVVLSLHQFFLKESHLGQNRATCSLQQLADLNPRVQVSAHTGALDEELLLRFQVRVLTTKCLWLKRFYWQTQDVPYFTLNPTHWAFELVLQVI